MQGAELLGWHGQAHCSQANSSVISNEGSDQPVSDAVRDTSPGCLLRSRHQTDLLPYRNMFIQCNGCRLRYMSGYTHLNE